MDAREALQQLEREHQALLQFDVGMASAGGLIAVVIANIAAIILVRMLGKNLTEKY